MDLHVITDVTDDDVRPFKCIGCPQNFASKKNLISHLKQVHSISEIPCVCLQCGGAFRNERFLREHESKVHSSVTSSEASRDDVFDDDDASKKEFSCTVCLKKFLHKNSLNKHVKLFHNKEEEGKKGSEVHLSTSSKARNDVVDAHDDAKKEYSCTVCLKKFLHTNNLNEHVKLFHNKKRKEAERKNGSEVHLSSSSEALHDVVNARDDVVDAQDDVVDAHHDDAKKEYSCTVCLKKFLHKNSLNKHVKLFHNSKGKKDEEGENGSEVHLATSLEARNDVDDAHNDAIKEYSCTVCFKKFLHEKNLNKHVKLIHRKNEGNRTVVRDKKIKGSSPPKKKKKHNCDTCNRDFKRISSLNHHKCNQICDICGKTLSSRSSLKFHLKRHSGIKSHLCQFCPKKFATSTSLRVHEKMHEGNQPFNCSTCAKKFMRKKDLENHVLVHERHAQKKNDDGIKNKEDVITKQFPCPKCPKSFAYEKSLKAHLRLHSGAFSCSVCAKYFVRKMDLEEHELAHELGCDKPFACILTGCDKTFKHKKNLTAHVKTCHNSKTPGEDAREILNRQKEPEQEPIIPASSLNFSGFCSICRKFFVNKEDLQEHELAHKLGEQPFACTATGCDKKFKHKKNLNKHVKTCHNPTTGEDEGPVLNRKRKEKGPIIDVPTCSPATVSEWRLQGLFNCSVCSKSFVKRTDLKDHERSHKLLGDDRPFACTATGCSKKFKRKKNLNAHVKNCHNPTTGVDARVLKKQRKEKDVPSSSSKFSEWCLQGLFDEHSQPERSQHLQGLHSQHMRGLHSQHMRGLHSQHEHSQHLQGLHSQHLQGLHSQHLQGLHSQHLLGLHSQPEHSQNLQGLFNQHIITLTKL